MRHLLSAQGVIANMTTTMPSSPHFHAEHQGQHAKFDLDGKLIVGEIRSRTALRLIRDWAGLHRAELEANWAKTTDGQPVDRIPPLE